ncbi:hypothetical protein FQN54_007166 [Arachnomyces sp. PD_36]|nr:hypothetical protein FQN54_007166 [Arachnomyces sp. PD_36]
MPFIRPEGADGGEPFLDSLGALFTSVAIIWTLTITAGSIFLFFNRQMQCIRIRNLPLTVSSVACLHVYFILTMAAYPMNGSLPCSVEYWVMSIYLPFGIALFQANNVQLLTVAGLQERMLRSSPLGFSKPPIKPHWKAPRLYWFRWREMSLLERTKMAIASLIVVQIVVSLSVFLASRKFNDFGIMSHHVDPAACRRGTEWIPSILWQLGWAWFFAPYILWKIRNIEDIHYWRVQTTICALAALPGSPLWLAALYSSSESWAAINIHWVPCLWFAPGIMMMEAVTIFIPCYEVLVLKRRQKRYPGALGHRKDGAGAEAQSDAASNFTPTTTGKSSSRGEMYSQQAFEKQLAEDSASLLYFAAVKEFTGENVLFLNCIRDWKAAWENLAQYEPDYDWKEDPLEHRLNLFKVAVEIYVAYVSLTSAKFPVNIESHIYHKLTEMFGEAAKHIQQPASENVIAPFMQSNSPDITRFDYNMAQLKPRDQKNPMESTEDTSALFQKDYPSLSKNIMQIDSRIPDDVFIPSGFSASDYDEAEKSVKYMIFTNTWPKLVDSSASIHSK